ncbi:hypothetical protein UlMin_034479 [Ulmus minor]
MEASSDQTAKDRNQNQNRPRMLNFNAPLLSIRRGQGSSAPTSLAFYSCPSLRGQSMINASDRIPFSWEESPGKPKDKDSSETIHEEDITPRPKLPPNWWHRTSGATAEQINENDDRDGFDGDVDASFGADFCGDIDDDIFSDAVDVFSLSEAIDIVEKSQNARKSDGLRLKLEECRNGGDDQYSDFIIQRFLPDATALAAASTLSSASNSLKKSYSYNFSRNISSSSELPRRPGTQSYSTPKACGLEMLFPWRVKHRLCGARRDSVSTIQLRRSDQKHKKR